MYKNIKLFLINLVRICYNWFGVIFMKKIVILFTVIFFFFLIDSQKIHAESNSYEVLITDGENTVSTYFNSFEEANLFYLEHFDEGNNIALKKEDKIIDARYALVKFSSNSSCTINTDFIMDESNESGYLNGCYGTDGAFLGLNSKKTHAKFMISGVVGWVKLEDIEIVLIENVNNVTSYKIEDESLKHRIKADFNTDRFSTVLVLDRSLEYLSENTIYYSYDGHYFYDDIRVMLDDYRIQTRINAINSENPYYNYYMMVSNRTMSHYTSDEIKSYLENERKIDQSIVQFNDNTLNAIHDTLNQSMMFGIENELLFYQNIYGANALMMLSLSMNESAIGRSNLAYTRLNLFGHAAYDSDVEKYASKYSSVASSVASHAKNYISQNYSNPSKFMYHGSYFGNKESGMNVSYASDPYWGEKAAAYYKKIDDALQNKDLNSVAIGIRKSGVETPIYRFPDLESEILASTTRNGNFAFVLLDRIIGNDELEYYKVQMDPSLNENGLYRFDSNVGYILSSTIDLILNEDKIGTQQMIRVSVDANGGFFYNNLEKIEFDCFSYEHIALSTPNKKDAEFEKWSEIKTEDSLQYIAQYKKINSIELIQAPKTKYFIHDKIDLENGLLKINYEDGSTKIIDLLPSMVSGYDLNESGIQTVEVSYCQMKCSYEIEVLNKVEWEGENLLTSIQSIDEETNLEELLDIKSIMLEHPDYFTFDQRRHVDKWLQEAYPKLNIRVSENPYNLQISNLALNVDLSKSERLFFKTPLDIKVLKSDVLKEKRMREIAEANEYIPLESFVIEGEYCSKEVEITIPLTVTIDKNDEDLTHQFVILHESNNHVEIVYSKQSDHCVTFEIEEWGNYLVAYRNTLNTISGVDPQENNFFIASSHSNWIYRVAFILLVLIILVLGIKKINRRRALNNRS